MDASRDAKPTAGTKSEIAGRLRSIAKIVIIDVAAPLIAYSLLRSAGMSTVTALVLSGVFPALGVAIGVIQHRRLDVVGALVLAGILAGTALSLSKVMPYIWVGIFVAWTVAYGRYQGKKGQRMMAAAAVEGSGTSDADPQPADSTKTAGQA